MNEIYTFCVIVYEAPLMNNDQGLSISLHKSLISLSFPHVKAAQLGIFKVMTIAFMIFIFVIR